MTTNKQSIMNIAKATGRKTIVGCCDVGPTWGTPSGFLVSADFGVEPTSLGGTSFFVTPGDSTVAAPKAGFFGDTCPGDTCPGDTVEDKVFGKEPSQVRMSSRRATPLGQRQV